MSSFGKFSKKLKVLKNSLGFFRTLAKNKEDGKKKKQFHFAIEQISALFIIGCILFVAEFGVSVTNASAETRASEMFLNLVSNNGNNEDTVEEKHNSENFPLSPEKSETKGLIFADIISSAPPEQKEEFDNFDNSEPLIFVQESALVSLSNGKDPKDFSERTEPFKYIVKAGDTPSEIADIFRITTNTVLWANSLNYWQYIKPGDELLILPVSGIQHKVISRENIKSIAKKYKADPEEIIAFNMLSADGAVKAGQILTIPGGEIKTPPPSKNNSQTRLASVSKTRKNIFNYQGKRHYFPYGYCTYYVSTRYPIPWSGHAKSWLKNARAYGFSTGKIPQKGAIVVTSESWWGHVAIVESISSSYITISEMNHKGWGKKSIRRLSINSGIIRGYIYLK